MWRLATLYYRLRRGPHGGAVIATATVAGLVAVLLAVALVVPALRAPAIALAGMAGLGALVGVVVLLDRLRAKVDDVHYALSLEGAMMRAGIAPAAFFTDGAAAGPSLQLFSLKVLLLCRPTRVLEFGSGQSTKLLSAYAQAHPEARVVTLEQNAFWIAQLREDVAHDYRHAPLERTEFICRGTDRPIVTEWYQEPPDVRDGRFDYILVDGPDPGTTGMDHTAFFRGGILKHMPDRLAESFVVVFDDAERYGAIQTIRALGEILTACQVRFVTFTVHGIKNQTVFCSPDRLFLRSV